jgi:hypothetical protein
VDFRHARASALAVDAGICQVNGCVRGEGLSVQNVNRAILNRLCEACQACYRSERTNWWSEDGVHGERVERFTGKFLKFENERKIEISLKELFELWGWRDFFDDFDDCRDGTTGENGCGDICRDIWGEIIDIFVLIKVDRVRIQVW